MSEFDSLNTRVLVIDDDEAVRDSLYQILTPPERDDALLGAEAALFDDATPVRRGETHLFEFSVDTAATGERGIELVAAAAEREDPYAVVFCDIRMPGIDGVATVERIREYDQAAEIIFVTAYNDYSVSEIVSRAGANVGYYCKPFSTEEVRQVATKAVYSWNKTRSLEKLISVIARLKGARGDLDRLLHHILAQVAELLGSRSALIARRIPEANPEVVVAIGQLSDPTYASRFLDTIAVAPDDDILTTDAFVCFPLAGYRIVALFESDVGALNTERGYIVRLFLAQASQILENTELQERLLRSEKLTAIGQAVSMAAHDMRGPIGAIKNALEVAALQSDSMDAQQRMRARVERAAQVALNLVNDIVDFAEERSVEVTQVELAEVLEQLRELLQQMPAGGMLQIVNSLSDAPTVLADQQKVLRILWNLVNNSAQALYVAATENPAITIAFHQDAGMCVLSVIDNGPGIPDEVQARMFEPFISQGRIEGTGLGLAIVRQATVKMGGTVVCHSEPGHTCFEIHLQLA
ncbi:MAG: hybrid sensor histidine kinase/response regulator [Pseudomonadota bacterium]